MSRSVHRLLVAIACGATAALTAFGQDPGGGPAAAVQMTPAAHRLRGILAWQRAAWTSEPAAYRRAAEEMEASLRAAPGSADVTTVFIIGSARARLGDAARGEEMVREGRRLAPSFAAHLLTEAIAQTGPGLSWKLHAGTRTSIVTLNRFLVELASYPPKAPFAAELRYLGLLERGMRLVAIDEHDRALRDLDAALDLCRATGRAPSRELLLTIAHCHKSLQQFEPAKEFLETALRRDPGEPALYHALGLAAADANRRAEAAIWNQRAVARKIDYVAPRAKLAYLAWEAGDLDAMRRQLESITHLQPFAEESVRPGGPDAVAAANLAAGWGNYWLTRGERSADAGDQATAEREWQRALAEFERALRSAPGCTRATVRIIEVLSRLRSPEAEIEVHRRRLQDMKDKKPGAPDAVVDTFC